MLVAWQRAKGQLKRNQTSLNTKHFVKYKNFGVFCIFVCVEKSILYRLPLRMTSINHLYKLKSLIIKRRCINNITEEKLNDSSCLIVSMYNSCIHLTE